MSNQRLAHLYLGRGSLPFCTPLMVHKPRQASYKWGTNHNAPGQVFAYPSSPHMSQNNYFEHSFGIEWQSLQRQQATAKEELLDHTRRVLENVIRQYQQPLDRGWTLLSQHRLLCTLRRAARQSPTSQQKTSRLRIALLPKD